MPIRSLVLSALAFLSSTSPLSAQVQAPLGRARLDVAALSRAVVTLRAETAAGEATGSGVIVDSTGFVVTASHVIAGATRILVRLVSGEELVVEGVAEVDSRLDIAVLRIAGFGLPTAVLGNSDSVQLGDRLLAIGSPLGLERTVTDGLLSSMRLDEGIRRMQVSIPVAPGSSGGPVFTEGGAVVGIIVSGIRGGGAENLNFAMPINYIRGKLPLLRDRRLLTVVEAGAQAANAPATAISGTGSGNSMSGRVNADLGVDFGALDGAEIWADFSDEQGARHIVQTVYRFVRAPGGTASLERTNQDRVRVKVAALRSSDAFIDRLRTTLAIGDAPTQRDIFERTPKMNSVQASAWALTISAGVASLSGSIGQAQYRVPLGAISQSLVGAFIAALPDSLPSEMSIWVFDLRTGIGAAERVEFGPRERVDLPFAKLGKPCDEGINTSWKKVEVVWVTTASGARQDRYQVLASRPHLRADPKSIRCVRVPPQ